MKIKNILFCCFLISATQLVFSQNRDSEIRPEPSKNLTKAELEEFKERSKEVVNQFNDKVAEIWRRPTESEKLDLEGFKKNKKILIKSALRLFLSNGEPWYSNEIVTRRDRYGNHINVDTTIFNRAVIMQTTSLRNPQKKTTQAVKAYLLKAELSKYASVTVTSSDAYFCSDFKKVGDGRYEAVLSFSQVFISYNSEGRKIYGDRTTKNIRVILEWQQTEEYGHWQILLGDIYATATEKI